MGLPLKGFGEQLPIEYLEPNKDQLGVRHYKHSVNGQIVRLSVTFRPTSTIHSVLRQQWDGLIQHLQQKGGDSNEERVIYEGYRKYAKWWFGSKDYKERGLHLYRWKGMPQLAMTFSEVTTNAHGWHRMYIFMVEDDVSGLVGEIDLAFSVTFNDINPESSFNKFLNYLPWIDNIADNLSYKGKYLPKEPMINASDRSFFKGHWTVVIGLLGCSLGIYLGSHIAGTKGAGGDEPGHQPIVSRGDGQRAGWCQ